MSINIWTDSMQHAELLGKPVLFTNWLIQRDIIPDGWYCYDLRGTHKSPSTQTTLVDHAADYHAGTVLSPIPLKHEGTASRRVNGTFYLLGEELTLEQFCEEHDLAYPQDNREFVLRPASLDEAGLFYSEEKLDEALGSEGEPRGRKQCGIKSGGRKASPARLTPPRNAGRGTVLRGSLFRGWDHTGGHHGWNGPSLRRLSGIKTGIWTEKEAQKQSMGGIQL